MIVKTSHKSAISPQKNGELNVMTVEGDSKESPIAITFESKDEMVQMIHTLSDAILSEHDTVHFYPKGLEYDKGLFVHEIKLSKQPNDIKVLNPQPMEQGED